MSARKRLILVRHCESEANAAGALQGYGDAPLTALGRRQALAVARRVAALELERPCLASSPMRRALSTAQAIRDAIAVEPCIDVRLNAGEGRAADQTFAEAGVEVAAAIEALWPASNALIVVTHRFPLRGYIECMYGADLAKPLIDRVGNGDLLEITDGGAPVHHPLGSL
jgi:broad specificity phosphatase PhoE